MKLLQINTSLNTSSTGKIVSQISKMVQEDGGESYIAYSGKYPVNTNEVNSFRVGSKLDFYWHALITRFFDLHGFGSTQATKKLIKAIDNMKPDIIHLHNLHGYYLNVEILFNYIAENQVPVVWTLHDCWSFTGHCSHFEFVKCNKWKKSCHSCPQLSSYPASILRDNSLKNFIKKKTIFNSVSNMTIVPVSKWLDIKLRDSFLSKYDSRVINNGIDLEVFKPTSNKTILKKLNIENKFVLLGVASVWTEKKGLFEFIKLSRILNEDYAIVLVGGPTKTQQILPKNIYFIPRIANQSHLAEIYSSSDLYLNLTFEDTFPTTNLESIACGTEVLTYKTGGSSESIHKGCGYVVNQGDIDEVKVMIEEIKNKSKASKLLLTNIANTQFDKNKNFNQYFKLYEEILNTSQ